MPTIVSKSFDGKHEVVFDEEAHKYWLDGEPCVGTTTFLKAAAPESPYLTGWKVGQGAEFVVRAFLERGRLNENITEEWVKSVVKESKTAYKTQMSSAASIGTLVHDYCYHIEMGTPFDERKIIEHPDAKKALVCISKFLEWRAQNEDEILSAEEVIAYVCPSHIVPTEMENEERCRCWTGKYDRLSRRKGLRVLSDFKTSGAIYLDHWLQLTAYRLALKSWRGVDIDVLEILRFSKTNGAFENKTSLDLAIELGVPHDELLADLTEQVKRSRDTYAFVNKYNT